MALHGKDGYLKVGSEIVNLTSYSLDQVTETGETTSMGDTWATHMQGLSDFSVTAEGKSKKGFNTPAILGTSEALAEFSLADEGVDYTGGVVITNITETAVVDDVLTISYTFEGNDANGLTYDATGGTGAAGTSNPIHGKSITAEWGASPTSFAGLRGWSITMSCPVSDSTAAAAAASSPAVNGRTKLAGINTATATVTILTPSATDLATLAPIAGVLNLGRSATLSDGEYQGTAIRTGIQTGVDTTGTEITVLSFQYTGAVTLAVA